MTKHNRVTRTLRHASVGILIAVGVPAYAQGNDDAAETDRLRSLAGLRPMANYVPVPSTSLPDGGSVVWFLDPQTARVIVCTAASNGKIGCKSAPVPSR